MISGEEDEQEGPTKLGQTFGRVTTLANVLIFVIAVIFVVALIALLVLCRFVLMRRCNRRVVGLIRTIEGKLMFNAVLRSMLESYL